MDGILAKRLDQVVFCVFDFETTGLSYEMGDKIVELAFVKFSMRDGIIEEYSSLVNPGIRIPGSASEIHGIYDRDVEDAPAFDQFRDTILRFLDGTILVGHNVYFDLRFLLGEMSDLGVTIDVPYLCTMGFPGFIGGKTQQRLSLVCRRLDIPPGLEHSALADTKATVAVLKKYIEIAKKENLFTFNDLKAKKRAFKFIESWEKQPQFFDIEVVNVNIRKPRFLTQKATQYFPYSGMKKRSTFEIYFSDD